MPLIVAEMKIRFYLQNALVLDDRAAADEVRDHLAAAWDSGNFDSEVERYAVQYGRFDLEQHVMGKEPASTYLSGEEYQNEFYKLVGADLAEACHPGMVSPIKAACETLRILRDDIRDAVEFQGLTLESYQEFQARIANRMKAAVAGPPARRNRELLALIDAGIVRLPWGPSPRVTVEDDRYVIESTSLSTPYRQAVDHLVRGYLPDPTIRRTQSALLRALYTDGRIRPFRYGDVEVGSIDMTDDMSPIGRSGEVQHSISVFGPLTEGVRYFTHYVPSPKSRIRAFLDAEHCAKKIFDAEAVRQVREPEVETDILSSAG